MEDMAAGCQGLITSYCYPEETAPVPTSPNHIPAVCTPSRTVEPTTTEGPPVPTSSPIQPRMVKGCKQFYRVLDGDTCFKVASQFGIALDQVSWTMLLSVQGFFSPSVSSLGPLTSAGLLLVHRVEP